MTNKEKNLEAVLSIAVGFTVLFMASEKEIIKIQEAYRFPLLYIAIVIGLCGMFSDFLADKIAWAWFKLAELLGMVMPKILLSIVFYVFLFPLALLSRIGGKDPMKLKKGYTSYYSDRTSSFKKEDFEKTW